MLQYTVQVRVPEYWWKSDRESGVWQPVYKDKQHCHEKKFASKTKAIEFMTTMNPYCNRKNDRRILKDNQVIIEF